MKRSSLFGALVGLAVALGLSACQKPVDQAANVGPNGMYSGTHGASALTSRTTYDMSGAPAGSIEAGTMVASASAEYASKYADPSYTGPGSQTDLQRFASDRIMFDTDATSINAQGFALVNQVASWMRQNPEVRLLIEGHADERGTREYNFALGEKRAQSVQSALKATGISPSRLKLISYGKEKPVVAISQPGAWAENRRAVLKVF